MKIILGSPDRPVQLTEIREALHGAEFLGAENFPRGTTIARFVTADGRHAMEIAWGQTRKLWLDPDESAIDEKFHQLKSYNLE